MDVKDIMSELDKNNDGIITAEEFKMCFEKLLEKLGWEGRGELREDKRRYLPINNDK